MDPSRTTELVLVKTPCNIIIMSKETKRPPTVDRYGCPATIMPEDEYGNGA